MKAKIREPKATTKAPHPGRPKRAHRQEEILDAAFQVFASHGFEAARIDEVAERAGVAKGTVYLYFRDKEQMFREVVRSLIRRRMDFLSKPMPGPPEDLLRALISQMYANVVRNPKVRAIVRMLVAEGGRFPQLAEIYHREIIMTGMNALREVLKRGTEAKEFKQTKATDFPQILIAPGLLAVIWQLLFGERHPLDLDAYRQAHIEFVLNGLKRAQD